MNYIVFVKQVPASTRIQIDPGTNTLMRSGAKTQTNPYDLHALQAAVELKKQLGGTITAITMGPPQAEAVLREAILFGADKAILLTDRAFAGSDTWSTSLILAQATRKITDASVLFFGKQAIDGDTAQVGPGVAARLDLPQVTEMRRFVNVSKTSLCIEKCSDTGSQVVKTPLPCVITVTKEANKLPAPTLRNWERAQQADIITWNINDLELDSEETGLKGSPTRVVSTSVPPVKQQVTFLNSVEELTALLLTAKE